MYKLVLPFLFFVLKIHKLMYQTLLSQVITTFPSMKSQSKMVINMYKNLIGNILIIRQIFLKVQIKKSNITNKYLKQMKKINFCLELQMVNIQWILLLSLREPSLVQRVSSQLCVVIARHNGVMLTVAFGLINREFQSKQIKL